MKTLLPHQIEDAKFLAAEPGVRGNFSGMGSGKTLTALEAIRIIKPRLTIIVGPPISLTMWKAEFEAEVGAPAHIVKTGKSPLDLNAAALIMSYDFATKRRDELKSLGANILICDESHALKNISAKRTAATLGKHGLCESVQYTWCLTGTPSTRYNDDLFSFLCRAAAPALKEKIGSLDFNRFRLRYCITQKKKFSARQRFPTVVTVGDRNTPELNEMLFNGPAVRRELKEVWDAMPPITINRLTVKLEDIPGLKQLLQKTDKMSLDDIRAGLQSPSKEPKDVNLATIRRHLGVAKVKASVAEIAQRVLEGNGPILVGAWHTDVIDALHRELGAMTIGVATEGNKRPLRVAVIDGRTNRENRDGFIAAFQAGELDILIGQIAAMGVAITLTAGAHVVCVEEDFSPDIMDQFFARVHRIGQTQHVHVDIFQSDTKIDKAVAGISGRKAANHRKLLDQGEPA
jgi:SNF2 family DNA or RNA helicase